MRLTATIIHVTDGTFTPYQEFDVVVNDPCLTATIANTGITSMTVVNGQTATQNFMKAADSVENQYQIFSLCGPRTYVIVDSTDTPVPWISITASTSVANQYTIKLTPTLDN